MSRDRFAWLWPTLFFIALLGFWQASGFLFGVEPFILPSPWQIVLKLVELFDRLMMHSLQTLYEVMVGFTLACLGGFAIAAVTAHSRFFARSLYPLLVISQVVPTIAIAPILVIWFGPGDVARLTVVFLIAFFPMVVNTTAGLLQVDEQLIELIRGLNGSRWKIFTKIRIPNSLPYVFTGMRISIALSVIGAVVAEFVAAERGLGYLIFSGATNLDTDLVFAAVVLLAAMGILLFQLVRIAQRIAIPWADRVREGEA